MIKRLFDKGIRQQIQEGNDREKSKVGTLRAGNTGMVMEDGSIVGSCAAMTYLRYKGINGKPVDASKELMFAGGRLNEDHWLSVLKTAYEGPILCEEDIPVSWETDQGIKVTGRPDIVLCSGTQEEAVPECMVELKQVMSINSAYNVLIKNEPQLKHLMQAAHYMWQLDCPGELWYTNRNNLDMPSWMEFRPFPKPGEPGSAALGYRYYRFGDLNPRTGKPKKHQITEQEYLDKIYSGSFAAACKILPFVHGFELALRDGTLYYKDASDALADWKETIVTIERIKRFYNFVGDLEQYGKVPREALNLNAHGEKLGWSFGQYSDLGDLDPSKTAGSNLEKWFERAKVFLAGTDKLDSSQDEQSNSDEA